MLSSRGSGGIGCDKRVAQAITRISHEHVSHRRMVRGVIRFRRWGEFVGDGGGVTVFLGTRPLSPVVDRAPGTAPKNQI